MRFKYNFSANTGYLWKELPFLDRLAIAQTYDFETVEFPYEPYKQKHEGFQFVRSPLDLKLNAMYARIGETYSSTAIRTDPK